MKKLFHRLTKLGKSISAFRRNIYILFKSSCYILNVYFLLQITLIDYRDRGRSGQTGNHLPILLRQRRRGIEDRQHQLRSAQAVFGTANPNALHRVVRFSQARRIRQTQRNAAEQHRFLHNVARGAGVLRHNGALTPRQQVHQRRFSDVRSADNHRIDPLAQHPPGIELVEQAREVVLHALQGIPEIRLVQLRNILLRVIRPRREMGRDGKQLLPASLNPTVERALAGRARGTKRLRALRADQLHH